MRDTMLIIAALAALGAVITGVLGFIVYPRQVKRDTGHRKSTRRRGGHSEARSDPLPKQGLARALFAVFAAAAFVALFFGMLLP